MGKNQSTSCTPRWIVGKPHTPYPLIMYEHYSNEKSEPYVQFQITQNENELFIQHEFPLL